MGKQLYVKISNKLIKYTKKNPYSKNPTEFNKNFKEFYFFTVFSTLFYPSHSLFRLFFRKTTSLNHMFYVHASICNSLDFGWQLYNSKFSEEPGSNLFFDLMMFTEYIILMFCPFDIKSVPCFCSKALTFNVHQ